jgi:hypothetical protein
VINELWLLTFSKHNLGPICKSHIFSCGAILKYPTIGSWVNLFYWNYIISSIVFLLQISLCPTIMRIFWGVGGGVVQFWSIKLQDKTWKRRFSMSINGIEHYIFWITSMSLQGHIFVLPNGELNQATNLIFGGSHMDPRLTLLVIVNA